MPSPHTIAIPFSPQAGSRTHAHVLRIPSLPPSLPPNVSLSVPPFLLPTFSPSVRRCGGKRLRGVYRHITSAAATSYIGLAAVVVWAVSSVILLVAALVRGLEKGTSLFPDASAYAGGPSAAVLQVLGIVPILSTAYTCQMTVHFVVRRTPLVLVLSSCLPALLHGRSLCCNCQFSVRVTWLYKFSGALSFGVSRHLALPFGQGTSPIFGSISACFSP